MISTRNRHLIISKHCVPVREVADAICDRMEIEDICIKFPVQVYEVMECMDCVADLENININQVHLTLKNASTDKQETKIETTSISDVFFLKVIQYGKVFLEHCTDFNELYDKGFRMCAIEAFEDDLNGSVGYESSDLHNIVFNAIMDIVNEDFDRALFISFLKEQDDTEV